MSRFQLTCIFTSLILLRVVVGFHFFKEGTTKLQSGNFSAKPFLSEAKGPYADYFHPFLDDPHGVVRLCLKTENPLVATDEEFQSPEISADFTFAIWNDFRDRLHDHYQFEDRNQVVRAERILSEHKQLLEEFLDANRDELIVHFGSTDRLNGFDRDGSARQLTAEKVESLREQVETIKSDRRRKLQGWLREVESIWDSLEQQLNEVAVDSQRDQPALTLHRPFSQPLSWQKAIDRVIPWFDTIVGALLILGLFTRFASLAAAMFLASVIATQPPWIAGTAPTYLYFVELAACLVIFATAAGKIGGLDFFLSKKKG